MNPPASSLGGGTSDEVSALIEVLHKSAQRLEELTAGEVDTVADRDGRTFLLRPAQDHLRHQEAAKQAAIVEAAAPKDIRAANTPQPPTDESVGIAFAKLADEQKQALKALVVDKASPLDAAIASEPKLYVAEHMKTARAQLSRAP